MSSAFPPRRPVFSGGDRFPLPVSAALVSLEQPSGAEEVLLAEHAPEDPRLTLQLVERLARGETGPGIPLDWAALTVTDIDTLIVRLRQMLTGDRIIAEMSCASPACGGRLDISFSLGEYLRHHLSVPRRRGWSAAPCADAPGWHILRENGVDEARFRLPTLADEIAVHGLPDAMDALTSRCIRLQSTRARTRARVETAMEALAPSLAGPLQGQCPECGAPVAAQFEARLYCLRELRDRARFVYDDVDILAERYHWSERVILDLPRARRLQYAERARRGLAA